MAEASQRSPSSGRFVTANQLKLGQRDFVADVRTHNRAVETAGALLPFDFRRKQARPQGPTLIPIGEAPMRSLSQMVRHHEVANGLWAVWGISLGALVTLFATALRTQAAEAVLAPATYVALWGLAACVCTMSVSLLAHQARRPSTRSIATKFQRAFRELRPPAA